MPRKINFREPVPGILIVSEGEGTEPIYFRDFKVALEAVNIRIEGLGRDPMTLVNETIKLTRKDDYDQVWIVFDIDNRPPDQINRAIQKAEQHGIRVVYSNQCFELWYVLHFDYFNGAVDRHQYKQILSRKLNLEYDKKIPGLYKHLFLQQQTAIKNAKRLLTCYPTPNPCCDDPSTTVFLLVEELNRFIPDSRR